MREVCATRETRILLVEDDAELRSALMEFLQGEGYRVDGACNGAEALARLRREDAAPDLILLDLMMPVMDGWQFRREQQRDPGLATTPVVVFSGDDSARVDSVDAAHHLRKPFDEQSLLASIAVAVQTRALAMPAPRPRPRRRATTAGALAERLVGQALTSDLRLVRKLAGGGMGLVFEGERADGSRVAVKLLSTEQAARPDALQRFTNESRAVASLRHPNIVSALEIGCTGDGLPFLVLELLEGHTLAHAIQRDGPLPAGRAARLAGQLASALAAAHAEGIIHRDVKPANVFLARDREHGEVAKILDFGVSKFQSPWVSSGTRSGELLGTPNYMAPEQLSDARNVDARTDVYGLGATLYEMLTGRPPYTGDNVPALFLRIMAEPAPSLRAQRPDLPADLAAAVERALAKDPAERWPTVEDLGRALERHERLRRPVHHVPLEGAPTPAEPVEPRAAARRRRGSGWVLALAALLALGLAGVASLTRARLTAGLRDDRTAPPTRVELVVRSPVVGARVRLRGVEHALPYARAVAASSAREPLEVVGPGRQGRRFWLVLDRAHQLEVELPPGSGVRDASGAELERATRSAAWARRARHGIR